MDTDHSMCEAACALPRLELGVWAGLHLQERREPALRREGGGGRRSDLGSRSAELRSLDFML